MATDIERVRITRLRDATPAPAKLNGKGYAQSSFVHDTLVNLVTGLGTNRDKLAHAQYALNTFTQPQLDAAYRSDWIARKVVDLPAKDSTRAWRSWQAEDNQIELIEEVEKRLRVQRKIFQTMVRARLYGGGAIIMGIDGTGDFSTELNIDAVKQDSLKFLHVVNKFEIGHDQLEQDIMSPWFDLPKQYTYSTQTGGMLRIHPSRVIRMIGPEIPSRTTAPDAWGDSILQIVNDAIIAAASVAGGIANLVEESKNDILKIPGLSENLGTTEYENRLTQRVALATQLKGLLRTTVIDSEEELNRLSASFASLPDIMEVYLMIASGAADIPATRMLGQSPRGLNATGESDIRNYYDRIASDQATELQPVLDLLDEVIIRSALGTRPPEIHYTWNALWQNTPEQKAEIAKKEAEAVKVDLDMGLINPDVLREVRLNQMTESGFYPGIEDAVEEFGAEPEEPEVDEEAIAALVGQQQKAQQTAKILPFREDVEKQAVGDAERKKRKYARLYDENGKAWFVDASAVTATLSERFSDEYDPNQPRAPKGSPIGGQWISGGAGPVKGELTPSESKGPPTLLKEKPQFTAQPSFLTSVRQAVKKVPKSPLLEVAKELLEKAAPDIEERDPETGELLATHKLSELEDPLTGKLKEQLFPELKELTEEQVEEIIAAEKKKIQAEAAEKLKEVTSPGEVTQEALSHLAMLVKAETGETMVDYFNALNKQGKELPYDSKQQLEGYLKWATGQDDPVKSALEGGLFDKFNGPVYEGQVKAETLPPSEQKSKPEDYNVDWLEQMADKVESEDKTGASFAAFNEEYASEKGLGPFNSIEEKLHTYIEWATSIGKVEQLANDPENWLGALVHKLPGQRSQPVAEYEGTDPLTKELTVNHPELANYDPDFDHAEMAERMIHPYVEDDEREIAINKIKEYTAASRQFNSWLRDGGMEAADPDTETPGAWERQVWGMDTLIGNARVDQTMLLWRGVGEGSMDRLRRLEREGKDYIDLGYVSTSTRRKVGDDFGHHGATIPVVVPPGAYALPVKHWSLHPNESEVILARRTRFRIRKTIGGGIYLEVIPSVE